jgi:type IV secretory pathway VirB3-like protein
VRPRLASPAGLIGLPVHHLVFAETVMANVAISASAMTMATLICALLMAREFLLSSTLQTRDQLFEEHVLSRHTTP